MSIRSADFSLLSRRPIVNPGGHFDIYRLPPYFRGTQQPRGAVIQVVLPNLQPAILLTLCTVFYFYPVCH